jgi:hypothetical protein
MARPKHLYVIGDDCHALSNNDECLTIQQAQLAGGSGPDNMIFLDRDNLIRLRAAIDDFLA